MLTIPFTLRRAAILGIATAVLGGCGDDGHSPGQGGASTRPPIPEACAVPAEGCPCKSTEPVKCGVTVSRRGDTLTCRDGERACADGAWSDCVGDTTTQIYSPSPLPPGVHTEGQATSASPCHDACDPYCQKLADTPDDLPVAKPLIADPTGLSLYSTGFTGGNCPDILIIPDAIDLQITKINMDGTITIVPNTAIFSARCGSATGAIIDPSWSADESDRATISTNGTVSVFSGIAGDVNVTAASVVDTDTALVHVKVNFNELATGATAADQAELAGAGTGTDPAKTLYPYKNTVFPLDLQAPIVQWQNGATPLAAEAATTPDRVEVALRYPAGSASPTFWYSKIFVGEPYDGPLVGHPALKRSAPAWNIPQAVWTAFSRTAKGKTGEIVIQRKVSGAVYKEMTIPVTFSTAALRGTVYYTQYLRRLFTPGAGLLASPQPDLPEDYDPLNPGTTTCPTGTGTHSPVEGGSTVLSIDMSNPAATNTNPFGTANGCPVCHSLSANGNVFVAGSRFLQKYSPTANPGTSNGFVDSITLSPATGKATFTVLGEAPNYNLFPTQIDWLGRGFAFSALTPDGSLATQGRYWWGNTEPNGGNNFTVDRPSTSGGQIDPVFFVPTVNPGVSVQFATTVPLNATRSGNVLTSNGAGLPPIDASPLVVNNSVLLKDQLNVVDDGIYTVTATGNCNSIDNLTAAAGVTAAASSTVGANTAANAFDNDPTTRWESSFSDPQWLRLDLGSSKPIGRVRIDWENAGAKDYMVQVATNAAGPWTTILNLTGLTASDHRIDDYGCINATGRYVRMLGSARATAYGYSIFEMDVYSPAAGGTAFSLSRRADADDDPGSAAANTNFGSLQGGSEFRITRGYTNYARVYTMNAPASGTVDVNHEGQAYSDLEVSPLPVMTMPTISPDGTKLAYVNGASDELTGANATAWRKGLTVLDFDQPTRTVSNKRRVVNNWAPAPGDGGAPIKWPFFERDSHSLLFVQTEADEYCDSRSGDAARACTGDGSAFANTAPTQRGYWKGSLFSVDSSAPGTTKTELSKLNDAENAWDADRAFQPTALPFASGGYRWVIFTSPRSYGNQLNQLGEAGPTDFSCRASMLWVSALDDASAGATDRSHPAFLLPGQQMRPITTQDHYVNERGYVVPSLCRPNGSECTTSDECCDPDQCHVDSISMAGVPVKKCKNAGQCSQVGEACLTNTDCCGTGSSCVAQKCVAAPNYTTSGTYTRDYVASCEPGFKPRWGLFSFHLTTPSDSHIAFSAQSAATAAEVPAAMPVSLLSSTDDNYGKPADVVDVGDKLEAGDVQFALNYLRITIILSPSGTGAVAPILHDWEQRYSCVPAE